MSYKETTRWPSVMEFYLCEIKTLTGDHGFKFYLCEVVKRNVNKEGEL